jgi:hypothetical protein
MTTAQEADFLEFVWIWNHVQGEPRTSRCLLF